MRDDAEASGWMIDQVRPEPCDPTVELSLAPGGRPLFLSDLHFTERGPLADFQARDALRELVESLGEHPGEVILALGGDVLDLLQLGGPRGEVIQRALAGADAIELGEALHRLGRRTDATIVYLAGNHDAALAWHGRGRAEVIRQLAVDHFGLRLRIRLEGPEGGEVRLVAEHGDAIDLYNRRTDPFDPLDSPAGDHIVTELVRRMDAATERRPDLALDEVNNVRPTSMVPTWIVANFFYRFLSRALRDVALPLLVVFLILHVPVVAALTAGLWGKLGPLTSIGGRLLRWAVLVGAVDVVLLAVVIAFVGRSLRQAVTAYGAAPAQLSPRTGEDAGARSDRSAALLAERDPTARMLLHGHSHQASFTELDGGKVAVDSGCWIRALMPVRAWLGLPPVFAPAYPCTWIEVDTSVEGVRVALWQRDVEIRRRLNLAERLLARRPLPPVAPSPPRVLRSTTLAYAATRPPAAAGAD